MYGHVHTYPYAHTSSSAHVYIQVYDREAERHTWFRLLATARRLLVHTRVPYFVSGPRSVPRGMWTNPVSSVRLCCSASWMVGAGFSDSRLLPVFSFGIQRSFCVCGGSTYAVCGQVEATPRFIFLDTFITGAHLWRTYISKTTSKYCKSD